MILLTDRNDFDIEARLGDFLVGMELHRHHLLLGGQLEAFRN